MATIVKIPVSSPLREKAYRLRYNVFIEEQQYHQHLHVDHVTRTIHDPLDETGHILAAIVDGEVVGTLRWNAASESDLEGCFEAIGIDPGDFENASLAGKLVVAPEHRGTTLAFRLAAAALVGALNSGIRFNIIYCEPSLVTLYERLGFNVLHKVPWQYPEGYALVMVLDLHDEEHLRRVRSPMLRHYLAWVTQEAQEAVCA